MVAQQANENEVAVMTMSYGNPENSRSFCGQTSASVTSQCLASKPCPSGSNLGCPGTERCYIVPSCTAEYAAAFPTYPNPPNSQESFAAGQIPVSFPSPTSTIEEPAQDAPDFEAWYSDGMHSRASVMTVSIELCFLSIAAWLFVIC
jgi:hypothetical protein